MATAPLPYLASYKNVQALFDKIATAKVPDKFTHEFLTKTIGLKGNNDRALIPLLRNLGFIDQSNTPSSSYRLLKGHKSKSAIAAGIKNAYAPLFDSDQDADELPSDRLKSLIAQVSGVDADATSRIASTFQALVKIADFETPLDGDPEPKAPPPPEAQEKIAETIKIEKPQSKSINTEFHYNLQIHLPANGNEETYLNIFNAIRKTFQ